MSFGTRLSAPFYTGGTTTSALVPAVYPVAIGGHPYLLDEMFDAGNAYAHASVPLLRPYFLTQDDLGERILNPEGLWRRSVDSWHKGAGQTHLDRPDSDSSRFRSSKGVDPWTRWNLSLLPDTTLANASANSNYQVVTVGTYLYKIDGQTLAYSTDGTTWTTVTGTPAVTATGICSDGNNVWVGYGASGIYSTTRAAAAAASYVTGTVALVAVVKGRLMCSDNAGKVYNITAGGALPTALFTPSPANTDWTVVGFAEGNSNIYFAGHSGDKSDVYRISIKADGSGLNAPIHAGALPDGETVLAIGDYLGFIQLGSSLGARVATADSNGDLTLSGLIAFGACRCFEGQDRFVWFGLDNYDSTSTGLGRMDLTVINDTAPAYSTDLMATAQGNVTCVVTFNSKRWFVVAGSGLYAQSANLVASGTIDSGLITYQIPDDKMALYLDVRHDDPLAGSHSAAISVDGGTFNSIGTHLTGYPEGLFSIPQYTGETFEVRHTLTRSGTDNTTGPTLTKFTLLSNPAVDSGEVLAVPILLTETELNLGNGVEFRDPATELAYLKQLRRDRTIVTYQEGGTSYTVVVDDYEWHPGSLTKNKKARNGTFVAKLKTVSV